jgi:carbamoyltransferase
MFLGLNDGHDAGVAVVSRRGEILFAANEERYTGVKQQWGFPARSLDAAFSHLNLPFEMVEEIAFGFRGLIETELSSTLERGEVGLTRRVFTLATAAAGPLMATPVATRLVAGLATLLRRNRLDIYRHLTQRKLVRPVHFIAHHEAHAASAYYTSGKAEACVITLDAGGDGLSGALWHGTPVGLRMVAPLARIHSLGDFWLAITLLCGFNPDRHGGKITGLAAYQECPAALKVLRDFYEPVRGRFGIANRKYLFWQRLVESLRVALAPFSREEISWAAQRLLEELVLHLVREGIRATGCGEIAVAGGIFANVKLNLEILREPGVESFFVHPHMGDGGTAVGAALCLVSKRCGLQPATLPHLFLGPPAGPVSPADLAGLKVISEADDDRLAALTAAAIRDNQVVGVVRGAMEYGPRALCNRSIIYHPFDATVMDWMNQRLSRTEFMPFAPIVRSEDGETWFEMTERAFYPARFMTICLPSRDIAREKAPAIVHIDGTARPQFISCETEPFTHLLLGHFGRLTGVPVLINTSFNRHEQPIVCTARQAVDELRRGIVDVLILDGLFVTLMPD